MAKKTSRPKTKTSKAKPKVTTSAEIVAAVERLEKLEATTPKAAKVIALLRKWLTDESGYDEETWPQLSKALNKKRRRVEREGGGRTGS
jgi:hypothetical protein